MPDELNNSISCLLACDVTVPRYSSSLQTVNFFGGGQQNGLWKQFFQPSASVFAVEMLRNVPDMAPARHKPLWRGTGSVKGTYVDLWSLF